MTVVLQVDEWIDGLATQAQAAGLPLALERHQTEAVRLCDPSGILGPRLAGCLLTLAAAACGAAPQAAVTLSLMVMPSAVHPTRKFLTGLLLLAEPAARADAGARTVGSDWAVAAQSGVARLRELGCDDVMEVHSPDKGSCLSFSLSLDEAGLVERLPQGLRDPEPGSAGEGAGETEAASGEEWLPPLPEPLRVLAVDDDALSLRIIKLALKDLPCELVLASDGISALDTLLGRLPQELPHIILMDLQMPNLDGLQTARAIKGRGDWAHIPIIAVSGHTSAGKVSDALDAGMGDLVAKPVANRSLLRAIRRQLAPARPPG